MSGALSAAQQLGALPMAGLAGLLHAFEQIAAAYQPVAAPMTPMGPMPTQHTPQQAISVATGDVKSTDSSDEAASPASPSSAEPVASPVSPPAPQPSQPPTAGQTLVDLIAKYESGNQNVHTQVDPSVNTASGYYQITDPTWRGAAPIVGVDLTQYPTAMSAPRDVQTQVAQQLLNSRGLQPWQSNTRLMAAVRGMA